MNRFLQSDKIVKIIAASVLLVAVSVFYKFIVEPIYTKHQLASCLAAVEKHIETVKAEACMDSKKRLLNDCYTEAQHVLYCRTKSVSGENLGQDPKGGFLATVRLEPYCTAPDNSAGYWNTSAEYQQMKLVCEEADADRSCKEALQGSLDKPEAAYREKEQAFCFRRY